LRTTKLNDWYKTGANRQQLGVQDMWELMKSSVEYTAVWWGPLTKKKGRSDLVKMAKRQSEQG
jgi:hypothetical protein